MTQSQPLSVFYRDDMAPADAPGNLSKSPSKPRRFLEFLRRTPLWPHVQVTDAFEPVTRDDLLLAHEAAYIDAFLTGWGQASTPVRPDRARASRGECCHMATLANQAKRLTSGRESAAGRCGGEPCFLSFQLGLAA